MTRSWLIFYGHMLGMSRRETLATRYGELVDLIACLSVYNGTAKLKKERPRLTFAQIMELR